MLTEQEIADHLYKYIKEGKESRANGTPNKYAAHTIGHALSCAGWLTEDLRLALMRKDESYCHGQALFEIGN